MKTEHTPGPWHISGTENPNVIGPYVPRQNGGVGILPIVKLLKRETPRDDANARLIAAAPEMLAALKDIYMNHNRYEVDHLRYYCSYCGRTLEELDDEVDECTGDDCIGVGIKKAIAKAEGKETP